MISAIGQDSHRFEIKEKSKPLILGGIAIDGPGLLANSDGDVVLHALINAISGISCVNILGSTADEMCKNGITDSKEYLREALKTLNGRITHVSFSIECLSPHLSGYISEMRRSIASLLSISDNHVGITATSGEGLTSFGKGEGISVFCIITVEQTAVKFL